FFSFETVLPERTLEAASGGIPEWGRPSIAETSSSARREVRSCAVLSDSPRHRDCSGRDWPDERDLTGDFCTSRIETGIQKGTGKCRRKRSRPSRSWVSCVRSKCW